MKRLLFALVLVSTVSSSAWASLELDMNYGLRSVVAMVINTDTDPVFCEHVENEMVKYLKTRDRFDFNEAMYVQFRDEVRPIYLRDNKVILRDKVEWLRPQIQAMKDKGVEAVILGEVFHLATSYKLSLVMVSTNDLEYIQDKDLVVEDHQSMESFTQTVIRGMDELERRIPFDGTVMRRNGFKVVIDRGFPDIRAGEELLTYTVEKRGEDEVVLEETGVVRITETGDRLSFGTILVERKPREVTLRNKILILNGSDTTRELAFARAEVKTQARDLGELRLSLGGSLVTVNNVAADGSGVGESSKLYPGGSIGGEIWLTNRTFLDLSLEFGMATLDSGGGNISQNSNITDMRAAVGYLFKIGRAGSGGPEFDIRAGYARHAFQVDASPEALSFGSTTYSGLLAGAGVRFDITDVWTTGFNINTLVFAQASEGASTSGSEITAVNGWDFSLYALYHWNESIDICPRLKFSSYSAEFAGTGTRPIAFTSATQSGQGLSVGVSYYF